MDSQSNYFNISNITASNSRRILLLGKKILFHHRKVLLYSTNCEATYIEDHAYSDASGLAAVTTVSLSRNHVWYFFVSWFSTMLSILAAQVLLGWWNRIFKVVELLSSDPFSIFRLQIDVFELRSVNSIDVQWMHFAHRLFFRVAALWSFSVSLALMLDGRFCVILADIGKNITNGFHK